MKLSALFLCASALFAAEEFSTSAGKVEITPIMHASLMIKAGGKIIYVDPAQGKYDGLPQERRDQDRWRHQGGSHPHVQPESRCQRHRLPRQGPRQWLRTDHRRQALLLCG